MASPRRTTLAWIGTTVVLLFGAVPQLMAQAATRQSPLAVAGKSDDRAADRQERLEYITRTFAKFELFAGEGKYKLIGHRSDEFPQLPVLENTNQIKLNGAQLVNAFNKTLFATGNDELRPVMSGVLCEMSPENITFVATDAHKLVRYRRNDLSSDQMASFILPKKPLNHLKNIIPDDPDAEVTLDYNDCWANIVKAFHGLIF